MAFALALALLQAAAPTGLLAQAPPDDPAASDPAASSAATLAMPADSGAPAAAGPAIEVVDIKAQASFTVSAPRVGDTLAYVLVVEWPETGVPVVILAPDSLEFQGLKITGQSTSHKKLAVPGRDGTVAGLANRTEFTWRLQAQTPGSGRASSVKLRFLTGLSRNEEARFIPAAHLDVMQARVALTDRVWFRLLLSWLGLAAAGGLAYACFRIGKRRGAGRKKPAKADFRPEVMALKSRLRAGDSKTLILEMEAVGTRWLNQELGPSSAADGGMGAAKFDPLLDRYLARNGSAQGADGGADSAAADWKALRDLFRHARFAGGHKEPHELQEAWRTLKRCLKITDEPGDD